MLSDPTLCRGRPRASASTFPAPRPRRQSSIQACGMQDRASAGGMARGSQPDSTSCPRISRRAHRRIRRRRCPAMIEHHRRAADNDVHTGLAVAKGVLDRWIDSRRGDRKSQADQGSAPPALYDLLAKLVGRGIVCERGTREFPCQGYVRRHRVGAVREHGAENRRTDTVTLRHCDGKLRARTAVLVAYGGNACGTPGLDGKVTPEPSEGVDPGKEPRGTRARVDHVADVTGVVVP